PVLFVVNQLRAERLERRKAEAELHVIGLYEPAGKVGADTEAAVQVTLKDKAIFLVLCAHESVRWKVQVSPGVEIVKVLVGGCSPQQVTGVDVPVEYHVARQGPWGGDYFYAYEKGDSSYEDMVKRVRGLTGKDVTSFQGQYRHDGRPFLISRVK